MVPSGDHAGFDMAPMPSNLRRRFSLPLSTSTMTSSLAPSAVTMNANSRPSGDQVPEESM